MFDGDHEKTTGLVCEPEKQTCCNSRRIIVKFFKRALESGCRYLFVLNHYKLWLFGLFVYCMIELWIIIIALYLEFLKNLQSLK